MCRIGMTGREVGPADGLGLADAIGLLRDELLEAYQASRMEGYARITHWSVYAKVLIADLVTARERP